MTTDYPRIHLKPGRERSVLQKHPWIYSGALQIPSESLSPGQTVTVCDANGKEYALGAYSNHSSIRIRIWSFDTTEIIDKGFFERRIRQSVELRQNLDSLQSTDAYRIVHGESDGLPGLIIDRYRDTLVVQFNTTGLENWRDEILKILSNMDGISSIIEKSDPDTRKLEGLLPSTGILYGENPGNIEITENGILFRLNLLETQKTGFYLDQRENRKIIREYASGKHVLDVFCYSGGFSLNALMAGAESITAIDSSDTALAQFQKNLNLNKFSEEQARLIEENAFDQLRKFRDSRERFDLIIIDPPKLAPTTAHVEKAARAYKDINLLAFKLLNPGGILATFSCSGGLNLELFKKIVADAALDAKLDARILRVIHQAEDHPVALSFPEGEYLKGIICQVNK
jgi:23S rRNA (cytosine1962-C5)-methyltransferase